jgi:peroxiredoxin
MTGRGTRSGRRSMRRGLRAAASVVFAVTLAAGLAACTDDPLADQYREGDNKGFIAASGVRYVEIPEDERTEPIEFEGVLDSGGTVTEADYAGDVVVVNFWYAACAPCRVEAAELDEAQAALEGEAVSFLGVNLYDGAEASRAFAETYGIDYPSALATEDGSIKLAFAGQTPLNAVPSTLVLDSQGRVAVRIIGQLEDASILETLVRETLEKA